MNNKLSYPLTLIVLLVLFYFKYFYVGPLSVAETPKGLGQEAYYQLEGHVFESSEIRSAYRKIKKAESFDENEAWVYLAKSMHTLVKGYRIGDWYRPDTFREGSVDKALVYAEKALSLGENESQAYAHLARIHIIKGNYIKAKELLDSAYQLDPGSFYPWYFLGILYEKYQDSERANKYLEQALLRAKYPYQKKIANIHQQHVAKFSNNFARQEALLKENIRNNPDIPTMYGNYASFLMKHERYKEAIQYWEMAIDKGPYGHAVEQLNESRRLYDKQLENR